MDTHETTIYTAVLITSIVLGAVIVYFIISIIRQQRHYHKSRLLAEITTLENERKRIASDLHDELGPILSSVKFRINSFDIYTEEDRLSLEKANQNIDEIISRMREISNDLMPVTLLRKGLMAAILASIENINESDTLHIECIYQDIPDFSETKAINLYRILQEVIHNTIKHSQASRLKIELKKDGDKLIILTEDNGVGFNYVVKSKEHAGLGLRNLWSRTEVLGGIMYIDSRLDKGTKYTFEIPI